MAYLYIKLQNADPQNPYRPGTMVAALYEEDFSDLTVERIAEVFGTSKMAVYTSIKKIKQETGKVVAFKRRRRPKGWAQHGEDE